MQLRLKNPHSILAALRQRPEDVLELRVPTKGGSSWDQIIEVAEANHIRVGPARNGASRDQRKDRKRRRGSENDERKTGREGAGEALVRDMPGVTLGELFGEVSASTGGHGLWLGLDCIQDPHNLGAIIRTASFFGVRGLLMTVDRAAPLSSTVYDVAAGGMEYLPFSVQTNLVRSLEVAKAAGLWILGSSEHAAEDISRIQRDRPWLLVVGNEASGLRRLTTERCDQMCRIKAKGGVDSLNASVAAGILIAALS